MTNANHKSDWDYLANLPHGWDGYAAEPPTGAVIHQAKTALEVLRLAGNEPNRVTASAMGGITIAFWQMNLYADLEMFNSGEILALTSCNDAPPSVWEVSSDILSVTLALTKLTGFVLGVRNTAIVDATDAEI